MNTTRTRRPRLPRALFALTVLALGSAADLHDERRREQRPAGHLPRQPQPDPDLVPRPAQVDHRLTGRDAGLDIFTVDLATQEYVRLTHGQGANTNKDPAFSPDCRLVAFVSDRRRGPDVYLASPEGFHQQRVIAGEAETVRWAH